MNVVGIEGEGIRLDGGAVVLKGFLGIFGVDRKRNGTMWTCWMRADVRRGSATKNM